MDIQAALLEARQRASALRRDQRSTQQAADVAEKKARDAKQALKKAKKQARKAIKAARKSRKAAEAARKASSKAAKRLSQVQGAIDAATPALPTEEKPKSKKRASTRSGWKPVKPIAAKKAHRKSAGPAAAPTLKSATKKKKAPRREAPRKVARASQMTAAAPLIADDDVILANAPDEGDSFVLGESDLP
jgi:hypothetical protein